MKRLLCLVLVLSLPACGGGGDGHGTLQLGELRGSWVVVNYWAEWCKPCIREIPELNALDREYPGVRVLGVNYDGASGEDLQRQLVALDVQFPTLPSDPAPQLGTTRPAVLPTTLILNPEGELVETLVGPQTLETLALATGQTVPTPADE
jgi:thiol-disulfide isomerase/thioredoxin